MVKRLRVSLDKWINRKRLTLGEIEDNSDEYDQRRLKGCSKIYQKRRWASEIHFR